jgi:8-oxo-dGTP pyrophosphatase MutT (NUDIX family)
MDALLFERIAERLREPLPGRCAQEPCAMELSFGRHFGPVPHDARAAAVMALLYRYDDQWRLPLIVRPPQVLHHANQVSLPGGLIESGENPTQAALRELEEELGIDRTTVEVLGQLSPLYVFSSNHHVFPVVGCLQAPPRFELNSLEVARLLETRLDYFLDAGNLGSIERQDRGISARAPAYIWDGEAIWGATCMIVAELVAVIREAIERART